MMNKKCETKDVVARLQKRFEAFAEIEHIGWLKDVFMPKVTKCCDTMDYHRAEFTEMK